ncbi:ABC transporter ATP-binding protein [Haloplasma contractile]|uniref:Multidrug ABC transporter ATP-binding protein n=1 Tax=Haloplasma contractile SSD-17B TaxID=1033810 RepID=U2EFZ8_9MOLU|nr:ATP-binding cassette domain-containing protein [Haloplasma contractile]ERJ13541.1 Multidrug ABC transporter ATP-binding protein [Haloplasma contractile SSD-17B]
MGNIIDIEHLVKKYDKVVAVDDISFKVKEGALFAFLGPNGAGKSTTINTLCTTLEKTSGRVIVNGYEVGKENDQVRNSIGVVFQESFLDKLLTVYENLKVRASFYNMTREQFEKRLEELVDVVGIREFINRRYGKLSGGQKRRVDIARALINKPKLLFLDEPTTGLDPQTRLNVWDTILRLQKEENMTIFLTTHYMEEAKEADEVVIIDHGKIVAQDTPEQLRLKFSTDSIRLTPKDMDAFISKIDCTYERINDIIKIPVDNSLDALQFLKKYEDDLLSFEVIRGNMDDVFVNITGREIR